MGDLATCARYKETMPVHHSHSEDDTRLLAANVAAMAKAGDVFTLDAPLGAGKSVFARAFIQSLLGAEAEVPSPTFTLVQTYEADKATIWHFDLYRLQDADEVFELGWEEAQSGIMLVEWASKAGPYLPPHARAITIDITGETTRTIRIHDQHA